MEYLVIILVISLIIAFGIGKNSETSETSRKKGTQEHDTWMNTHNQTTTNHNDDNYSHDTSYDNSSCDSSSYSDSGDYCD